MRVKSASSEAALRQLQERLDAVGDLASDWVYAIRFAPGGAVIREWTTGAFTKITGFSSEELDAVGGWANIIHPEDTSVMQHRVAALRAGREDVSEYRIITKDGDVRWIRDYGRPLRDSDESQDVLVYGAAHDITTSKQAEDELWESERRYRALVEDSLGLICSHDLDGNLLSANPAAARSLGYPPDEMIGMHLAEILAPSVRHLLPEFLEDVRTEGVASGLMRTLSRTGEERFWTYRSTLHERDGETPYVIGHAVDITEQKAAERALRKAREELERRVAERTKQLEETSASFRRLVETTNVIPWEADPRTWKFTYVGPQAERILGYPIDRWCEQDFWAEHIHPEDREQALTFCLESSQKYPRYEFEYRMMAADGSVVWLHDLVSVEAQNDEPQMLRGFMIDITERKHEDEHRQRSARRMGQLLQAMPDTVLIVRHDGTIALANEEAYRMFGYEGTELVDLPIEHLIPRGLSERRVAQRAAYAADPKVRPLGLEFELRGVRRTGEEFPVELSLSPLETEEGVLTVCDVRDLTDRKRIEAESRRLRNELTHISRLATMGELAAALAHELNQPLTAIVSNAQAGRRLFGRGEVNHAELDDIFTDIAQDGKRAGEVIRRLRGLLKRGELEPTPLDLNVLVQEIVALVQSDAVLRKIRVRLDLAPDLPPVLGDRVQLQQVLINLIMNGFEAIGSGATELTVKTITNDGDDVMLAVEDTGPGITPDAEERLFDPFFTTKPEGMGMGLAISRSIVEAHGGRLWARNNRVGGATFYLALPVNGESGVAG